ncbi:MAG: nitroreductase family protein [Ethanoligenens sp.]
MEFSELIQDRYSVRKYSKKPVEPEKLQAVLEAGRIAPTAGNRQPQRILVVDTPEGLQKMKKCTTCSFDAPVVLLVCYDTTAENNNHLGDHRTYGQVDASIVMTHMMLAAWNVGLGNVWVGLFKPELLKQYFNIPDDYRIVSLMPIGYAADEAEPGKMHGDKFSITHTVFHSHF